VADGFFADFKGGIGLSDRGPKNIVLEGIKHFYEGESKGFWCVGPVRGQQTRIRFYGLAREEAKFLRQAAVEAERKLALGVGEPGDGKLAGSAAGSNFGDFEQYVLGLEAVNGGEADFFGRVVEGEAAELRRIFFGESGPLAHFPIGVIPNTFREEGKHRERALLTSVFDCQASSF
jgi:hypothetical protein